MSINDPSQSPWASRMLSLYRIVAGLLFMTYGTMKMFGYPPPPGGGAMPPFNLMSQMGAAGILEVFGGLAIALGLFTRPVAFILAGEMAVAYFQFHQPEGLLPPTNNGSPAVLYCLFFLYLIFAGAGPWSLDAILARRRTGYRT